MDDEIKNFIRVWIWVTISISYCYFIVSKHIPKGLFRLFSLLPIFSLFLILPLSLSSIYLCAPTTVFLVWLSTFKLILFSFDLGPLSSSNPPHSLFHFISIASLPIKIKTQNPNQTHPYPQISQNPLKPILLAFKALLLALVIHAYDYKSFLHPNAVLILYCFHLYFGVELFFALCAAAARAGFGFELEPQFIEPYLATSLQDFWGHRWNLMVSSALRDTVYLPVRRVATRVFGTKWAPLVAMVAAFTVSGLMHEVVYFYITRVSPTWEVTWFFVLHGVCTAAEVVVKKAAAGRWGLHRAVSGPLTVVFVVVSGRRLFFPQLVRNGVPDKAVAETYIVVNFVRNIVAAWK